MLGDELRRFASTVRDIYSSVGYGRCRWKLKFRIRIPSISASNSSGVAGVSKAHACKDYLQEPSSLLLMARYVLDELGRIES